MVSTTHFAAMQPCPMVQHVNMQNAVAIGHIFYVVDKCNLFECVAPYLRINWYVCTGGWLATCGAVYTSTYWSYV